MRWLAGIPILLTLASVTAVTQAAPDSGLPTRTVTIPAGTVLLLEFSEPVTLKKVQESSGIALELRAPVAVGGQTIVPAGSRVDGAVERIETQVNQHEKAALQLQLNHIILGDGSAVDLTAPLGARPTTIVKVTRANNHRALAHGAAAPIILGSTLVGATLRNPLLGAGIGVGIAAALEIWAGTDPARNLRVRRGHKIDVVLDHPVEIDFSHSAIKQAGL